MAVAYILDFQDTYKWLCFPKLLIAYDPGDSPNKVTVIEMYSTLYIHVYTCNTLPDTGFIDHFPIICTQNKTDGKCRQNSGISIHTERIQNRIKESSTYNYRCISRNQ